MEQEKKKNTKRVLLIIACVVLSVVLVVMVAGLAVYYHFTSKINRAPVDDYTLSQEDANALEKEQIDAEGTGNTAPSVNASDVIWDDDPSHIVGHEDDIINILLIGQDRRPGEGRARSDSMILCTFNNKTDSLTLTSFMRDMYVQIPGYEDTRINAAYALGGMDLLDNCLKVNFGVHVDGNFEVDFTGFESVIDALGGVDIELTSSEAGYLNRHNDFYLSDGMNHLTGKEALAYSRIRYIDDDFCRTNRQRNVLNAVFAACKNMDSAKLWNLLNTVLPMLTTDMTEQEITAYATQIIPKLSKIKLVTQRIPVDDGYEFASIRGMSVLIPYLDKNREFLIDTLSPAAFEE